jgi:hypothetical protein
VDVVLQELGSGGRSDYLSLFGLNSRVGDELVNNLDRRFGVKGDNNLFSSTGTTTITPATQATADQQLLQDMLVVNSLRNRANQPLLNPGPPTTAWRDAAAQRLNAAAAQARERFLGKK